MITNETDSNTQPYTPYAFMQHTDFNLTDERVASYPISIYPFPQDTITDIYMRSLEGAILRGQTTKQSF